MVKTDRRIFKPAYLGNSTVLLNTFIPVLPATTSYFIPLILQIIFWFSLSSLIYIYIGYPTLLFFLSLFKKQDFLKKEGFYPSLSLIIPAYNEEDAIKARIENILHLHYPKEKLEVIIISDSSTDHTDEIVSQYNQEGILLKRLPKRSGKMAALNLGAALARGEVLVFSDADVLFKEDNLEKLAAYFFDPQVGCVAGAKKIVTEDKPTSATEGAYWKYELFIKKLEAQTGFLAAGASGCNFAIRKKLYAPLNEATAAEDLFLPLMCMSQGYRVAYTPEAISYECLLPSFRAEFRRKIRIVMAGLHALGQLKSELTHLDKLSLFKLFSHKVLRWYSTFFLAGLLVMNCFILDGLYGIFFYLQLIFYSLAGIGFLLEILKLKIRGIAAKLFGFPLYFVSMNLAAAIGLFRYSRGRYKGWVDG